jgi:hypothetical protein
MLLLHMSPSIIRPSKRRTALVVGTVGGWAVEHNRVFGKAVGRDVSAYVSCFRSPAFAARLGAYVRLDVSVEMFPVENVSL